MTFPFTPLRLALARCACATIATLALGSAAANNGIVTTTADETVGPFYIPCLNDNFMSYTTADVRTHWFQTSGGTTHLIDNWSVTTLVISETSGHQWAGTGVSPLHANKRLDGGVSYGWTASRRLDPLDGVGPSLVFTATVKFVKNALGEVVVDMAPVPGTSYNCLGPKG